MAKFFELSEENQQIFEEIWERTGMFNYIDLKLLGISKSKEIIKVQKTNPTAEYLGKCPGSVTVCVYEQAFDRLNERGKKMLADDALMQVSYDGDKDKINVGCPHITVTIGGRAKYGEDLLNYAEAGLAAITQIGEEEAEKKAASKAAKATMRQFGQ